MAAVQKDPRATAARQEGVGLAVPVDGQVLDGHVAHIVAAQHGESALGDGAVRHQVIRQQRLGQVEHVPLDRHDARHRHVKAARAVVAHGDAAAGDKPGGIGHRHLLLAIVAVEHQGRGDAVIRPQDDIGAGALHVDAAAQVQRIAHGVEARADLDDALSEPADIVHRRLQRAVVGAHDIRSSLSDGDPWHATHGSPSVSGGVSAAF